MARPKSFDQDQVLTAAMKCFWRNGYTATSMKDLESATGLTPGSIYNSFGSKDALFLGAIDHYIEQIVKFRVNRYLVDGDPIQGIEDYFYEGFRGKTGAIREGCLLINTSTELGPHDDLVRKRVRRGMSVAQRGLEQAIERAKAEGQLAAEVDSVERARHLGLLLNGMLVQTKVSNSKRWLDDAMVNVRALLQ